MNKEKEDYLVAVYKIQAEKNSIAFVSEISKSLEISNPSVSEMTRKLSKLSLVEFTPYQGISLTIKGIHEARKITRKHRILEVFFSDVLKISSFHDEAHKLEHEISEEATENMNALLKNPKFCPDGNPIPKANGEHRIVELSKLGESNEGKIIFSKIADNAAVSRLNALGLMPFSKIKITRKIKNGPIMIFIKGSEIAIGDDFSENIFVEVEK